MAYHSRIIQFEGNEIDRFVRQGLAIARLNEVYPAIIGDCHLDLEHLAQTSGLDVCPGFFTSFWYEHTKEAPTIYVANTYLSNEQQPKVLQTAVELFDPSKIPIGLRVQFWDDMIRDYDQVVLTPHYKC